MLYSAAAAAPTTSLGHPCDRFYEIKSSRVERCLNDTKFNNKKQMPQQMQLFTAGDYLHKTRSIQDSGRLAPATLIYILIK